MLSAAQRAAGIDELRRLVPAATSKVQLNSGTAGPMLTPVIAAMRAMADAEAAGGRAAPDGLDARRELVEGLRSSLAALVGAEAEEVAVTASTGDGMNVALWGLPWAAGDRVVTTSLEHPSALLPLYQLHRRLGVVIDVVDLGDGEAGPALDALTAALAGPCRLLVVSHVAYGTGAVLPLAELVDAAHARGVPVLVDGAQSVGAMGVDCAALDVDLYAFPGQKWLCGPEGVAGLVVRRGWVERMEPTYVGYAGVEFEPYRVGDPASLAFRAGAARYESGTRYQPVLGGLRAASDWHQTEGSRWDVTGRIASLAGACRAALAAVPGVEVLTPAGPLAGLVAFRLVGVEPEAAVDAFAAEGIVIREIPDNGALRISCGFFNTDAEVDRAVALAAQLASRGRAPGKRASG